MKMLAFSIAWACVALHPAAVLADTACALCSVVDSTGLGSQPCEVSGWNSSVTATLDMSSSEARKVCAQVAALLKQKGISFDAGWTLQIRSPYSGDNTIAYCDL